MKEHPILFNGEMVRRLLDGRKTQTRRVIKPQPEEQLLFAESCGFSAWVSPSLNLDEGAMRCCPYGVPGDRLWVRETWFQGYATVYRADYPGDQAGPSGDPADKWRPSIHMPRWASRITLEVTGVRVERVQDISIGDAYAEGISDGNWLSPVEKFILLWDGIYAKRGYSWESNAWVWVVEFEVTK